MTKLLLSVLISQALVTSAFAAPSFDPKVDRFRLGIPTNLSSDKTFEFNKGLGSSNPSLGIDGATGKFRFSLNGSTFKTPNLGTDIDSGAAASGNVLSANGSGGTTWAASLSLSGMLFEFPGTACPGGSLLANGTILNRTTYAKLFTAIGTTWGDEVLSKATPNMTSNTAPSGTASASTTYADPLYYAWRAFSGLYDDQFSNGGGWITSGLGLPAWVQYQFTSGQTIQSYSIRRYNATSVASPKDFKLQGSNNGSTWSDLDTRTNITSWNGVFTGPGSRLSFTVATPGSYTYYRLYITAINGDGTTYVGAHDLKLSTSATLGFRAPDLRNRFIRGSGTNSDGQGGDAVLLGQYQADVFKDHTHGIVGGWDNNVLWSYFFAGGYNAPGTTGGASSGSGTETRPKNYGLNYCIVY